jgi:putative MATE family efflux protein
MMLSTNPSRPLFGPVGFYRQTLSLAVPVMLQQLLMSMVSLIDNFMVAGLGDTKMAAVNVANQMNFVYMVILNTLCASGGIYISQFRGASNEEGMKQAFRFKVVLAFFISTVYLILCQVFPESMLRLMTAGNSASEGIVREGAAYMRIVSIMWIPIGISAAIGTSYRDIGRPSIPLLFSVSATLVNTFLNWVLIYGNLGAPRLEIAGAAIATNIARAVELLLFLSYTGRKKPLFHVPISGYFAVKFSIFREILSKSALMLVSEGTWVVSETITTALYNGRGGAEVVAGMAAGWTIANLFFLVFGGIHVSTSVILGGLLGSGKLDEAKRRARWLQSGWSVGGIVMAGFAASSVFLVPIVFANLSLAATSVTKGLILVIAMYLPIWSLLNAQFAIARSGGDMMFGIAVDVTVTYLAFLPGAFALALLTPVGPVTMYAIVKLSDFLKLGIAFRWLKKERWVKNLTVRGAANEVVPEPLYETSPQPGMIGSQGVAVAPEGESVVVVTVASTADKKPD